MIEYATPLVQLLAKIAAVVELATEARLRTPLLAPARAEAREAFPYPVKCC